MAYLGQIPATGSNKSFRILDDITSYTLTFDGSSAAVVSAANETITLFFIYNISSSSLSSNCVLNFLLIR